MGQTATGDWRISVRNSIALCVELLIEIRVTRMVGTIKKVNRQGLELLRYGRLTGPYVSTDV